MSDEIKEEQQNGGFRLLKKKKNRIRPFHIVIALILMITVGCTVFLAMLPVSVSEWFAIHFGGSASGSFPCSLTEYGSAKSVSVCSDYYIVMTDSHVVSVNGTGGVVGSVSHGYADCVIKTSDHRFMVFNRRSSGYQIHNAVGMLHEDTADGNIITADIADDGTYAVAIDTNCVNVYNSDFEKIYKFQSSEKSIVDVDISGKSGRVAVASVSAADGRLTSTIQAYRLNSEQAQTKFEFDGLALDIEQNGSDIIVIGDERCAVYNSDGEQKGAFDYNGRVLSAMEIYNGQIMIALSDSANSQQKNIYVLSSSVEIKSQITCDKVASSYGLDSGRIYVLSDKLYAYDYDGEITDSYDLPTGASDFTANGGDIVAVGYEQLDLLTK